MIDFLNNLNCLEVVFRNYYYCECFYWVNFDLSLCAGEMICLVLCTFVVYFDFHAVFFCIQQCYVSIFGNSYTIF